MAGSLDELLNLVEGLWNCYDIAGNASVLRHHADQWRRMEAELRALADDLQASVAGRLAGGRDGNWNDQAGENFQQVWGQTRKQMEDLAPKFGQVADQLDAFASQVDNFNDNFHTCLITLAACTAVMVATSWIPGVDLVTDGGGAIVDAAEVDEAWNLINTLKTVLTFLRSNLVKDLVFDLAKNFAINFAITWGSRLVERGIMLGDPTEGWSPYDRTQILLLSGLSTLPGMIIPRTPLGQWAALPEVPVTSLADLPWGQFLKASLLRIGQTEILANTYNLFNKAVIQGKGLNFNLLQLVGVGSASTGAPTLLIIAGNAVWFLLTRGTSGLPQGLTMPTLVSVNTVLDVGLGPASTLVRNARGLVYTTAGGQLPATTSTLPDDLQSMIGAPPIYVVKPGDTLRDIAVREYGAQYADIGVRQIVAYNHLTGTGLHIGERLVLPAISVPQQQAA
ncbi:MAG TPA: LysM peptidoglycan-binding domain-containing protein [Candidatus Dormibacteraeota bacterium]|nr:LysM peptidoglycan-binding domain-containing protein [Candidatus Dormibacteraeota bacterium]